MIMEITCPDCKKTFETKRRFKTHCKKESHENYFDTQWKCKFCGIHIFEKSKRGRHVANCTQNKSRLSRPRKLRKSMSEETRKKISEGMKKAIKKNPLVSPFIRHSLRKERSYLEKKFKEELIKRNIEGWIEEFFHGVYRYDFAFPSLKIDVEIDGSQHTLSENIEKDRIRDEWSISRGWRVLRIQGRVIRNNIDLAIEELLKFIGEKNLEKLRNVKLENYLTEWQKKKMESKQKKLKKIEEVESIILEKIEKLKSSKIDFSKIGWVKEVSCILEISQGKTSWWMKKHMPEFYEEKCFKKGITKHSPNFKSKNDLLKEKILNSGIDFTKKGWNKELQKLTGKFRIKNFVRENLPDIWNKCFKPNYYGN